MPLNDAHFQVRHPNLLLFLPSSKIQDSNGATLKVIIYIVIEPIILLSKKIKVLGLEGTQRYEWSFLLSS